jgi:tRNA-dihydrouridine synthase B
MLEKNHEISLGPFQGITDVVYRRLFHQYFGGIDRYYTPFFTGFVRIPSNGNPPEEIDPRLNDFQQTIPQILSKEADEIQQFGKVCHQFGFSEINWNLGCPYPRVANKKRGSGLLPYPAEIENILKQLDGNLPVGLSIKCRLGFYSPDEMDALTDIFNAFPLSELIVHARIGKQLYKGAVLEDDFAALQQKINSRLVYNGDIFSTEHFERFQQSFPEVNHWMVGRGLLANPFLALELKGICSFSDLEKKEIIRKFMEELFRIRLKNAGGNLSCLGRMKELWSYMVWSFDEPIVAWRLIRKARTIEEYRSAMDEIFLQLHWIGKGFTSDRSW